MNQSMLLLGEYPLSQSLLSCCFIYKPLASLQSLSAFTSELDMKHFTGIIHPNLPHSCDSHHREMGLILYSIHFLRFDNIQLFHNIFMSPTMLTHYMRQACTTIMSANKIILVRQFSCHENAKFVSHEYLRLYSNYLLNILIISYYVYVVLRCPNIHYISCVR